MPYLLNPAGIAALVIASSEIDSLPWLLILVGLVPLVGAFDWLIFSKMDRLARHLDPSILAIQAIPSLNVHTAQSTLYGYSAS